MTALKPTALPCEPADLEKFEEDLGEGFENSPHLATVQALYAALCAVGQECDEYLKADADCPCPFCAFLDLRRDVQAIGHFADVVGNRLHCEVGPLMPEPDEDDEDTDEADEPAIRATT